MEFALNPTSTCSLQYIISTDNFPICPRDILLRLGRQQYVDLDRICESSSKHRNPVELIVLAYAMARPISVLDVDTMFVVNNKLHVYNHFKTYLDFSNLILRNVHTVLEASVRCANHLFTLQGDNKEKNTFDTFQFFIDAVENSSNAAKLY